MKNGGATVRVLRNDDRGPRLDAFNDLAVRIAEMQADMCGFAIIAWNRGGTWTGDFGTIGAPIPIHLVPEFVKTCLIDIAARVPNQS